MARIRSIHPGQPTDEDFVSCSPWARLLAILVRNQADDQGVFEWKPVMLKMRIFPADNLDVSELLEELIATNQVRRYEIAGRQFGAIRNFGTYQSPKSPKASYPITRAMAEYTDVIGRDFVTISEIDGGEPPEIPNHFRNSSAEGVGVGVGEEDSLAIAQESDSGSANRKTNNRLPSNWEQQFEAFWRAYPSRGRANNPKKPAKDKFAKLIRDGTDPAAMLAGAAGYAAAVTENGNAGTEYVQQAKTWLNQAGWEQYQPDDPQANGQDGENETVARAMALADRRQDQDVLGRIATTWKADGIEAAEVEAQRYLDQQRGAA